MRTMLCGRRLAAKSAAYTQFIAGSSPAFRTRVFGIAQIVFIAE